MKNFLLLYVAVSLRFLLYCLSAQSTVDVSSPPRGWNSYDSYSWIISEDEYLQNAQILSQRLLDHGYQYAVVDYLWYRNLKGDSNSRGSDSIDQWGRMIPDPERWPSSTDGVGFKGVADTIHSLGLKFGIHLMAGISTQAYDANTPILDTTTGRAYQEYGQVRYAKDIGMPERACKWMSNGFMAINATSGAGTAFLRSLYVLYASWGVDFVKLDCVFGDDLDQNEIIIVAQTLENLGNNIALSLSPGVSATPQMADGLSTIVDSYRITGDDWDEWPAIVAHFDVIRDFAAAKLIGSAGLHGQSYPDMDMLPFGWLTDPGVNKGPHRMTRLTQDEQRTQMTLWSMAKSPLMFGGDLRQLDDWTYDLITNPTLLTINSLSKDNQEFPHITSMNNEKNEGIRDVAKVPSTPSIVLIGCSDPKASGWSVEKHDDTNIETICYKNNIEKKDHQPFCLYKIATPTSSQYQSFNLVDIKRKQLCLDPFPKRKLKAQEVRKQDPFSPCTRSEASQMWELKSNGTLFNGHSTKCATVEYVQGRNNNGGIRSWIATGTLGTSVMTYVAFFNLNDESTRISAKVEDLGSVLSGRNLRGCIAMELWSGSTITVFDTLSAQVVAHGCALFVISC